MGIDRGTLPEVGRRSETRRFTDSLGDGRVAHRAEIRLSTAARRGDLDHLRDRTVLGSVERDQHPTSSSFFVPPERLWADSARRRWFDSARNGDYISRKIIQDYTVPNAQNIISSRIGRILEDSRVSLLPN